MIPKSILPSFAQHASPNIVKSFTTKSNEFNPTWRLIGSKNVPFIQHGLSKILNSKQITRMDNEFDHLKHVPQLPNELVDNIQTYTPPSKDERLLKESGNATFLSATSTTTGILSQIYYLLSDKRPLHVDGFTSHFDKVAPIFTRGASGPVSIVMRRHNKKSTIDADKSFDSPNVLTRLGHVLEYRFTMTNEQFDLLSNGELAPQHDSYNTLRSGNLFIRSQLDCQDPQLKRQFFDIKTRAVLSIRTNISAPQEGTWYRLEQLEGQYLSFERELFDMVRAAFLKYYFQVCIGNMDGIFVAYHNTEEIFGFEYMTRERLAQYLFGSAEAGESIFASCVQIMDQIMSLLNARQDPVSLITMYYEKGQLHLFQQKVAKTYTKLHMPLLKDVDVMEKQLLRHHVVSCMATMGGEAFTRISAMPNTYDICADVTVEESKAPFIDTLSKYRRVKYIESAIKQGVLSSNVLKTNVDKYLEMK